MPVACSATASASPATFAARPEIEDRSREAPKVLVVSRAVPTPPATAMPKAPPMAAPTTFLPSVANPVDVGSSGPPSAAPNGGASTAAAAATSEATPRRPTEEEMLRSVAELGNLTVVDLKLMAKGCV